MLLLTIKIGNKKKKKIAVRATQNGRQRIK